MQNRGNYTDKNRNQGSKTKKKKKERERALIRHTKKSTEDDIDNWVVLYLEWLNEFYS